MITMNKRTTPNTHNTIEQHPIKHINTIEPYSIKILTYNKAGKWASTRSALETPDVGGMV
jgi:hypothetical protein